MTDFRGILKKTAVANYFPHIRVAECPTQLGTDLLAFDGCSVL
jgi:hypothetical protein